MDMRNLEEYWNLGFHQVNGWVESGIFDYLRHLEVVQKAEGIKGNIAEIGVFEGKFLIALSYLATAGEICVAVDVFDEQDKNVDGAGEGNLEKLQTNISKFAPSDIILCSLRLIA